MYTLHFPHCNIFGPPPPPKKKIDSMTFGVTLVFSVMIITEDYFVDVSQSFMCDQYIQYITIIQ